MSLFSLSLSSIFSANRIYEIEKLAVCTFKNTHAKKGRELDKTLKIGVFFFSSISNGDLQSIFSFIIVCDRRTVVFIVHYAAVICSRQRVTFTKGGQVLGRRPLAVKEAKTFIIPSNLLIFYVFHRICLSLELSTTNISVNVRKIQ